MNIDCYSEEIDVLNQYMERVLSMRGKLNLTSIHDRDQFFTKHILDSLMLLDFVSLRGRGIDIGTGGGFPLIPLAVTNQKVNFWGLDSVNKKLSFIEQQLVSLGITNVNLMHGRAEDVGRNKEMRESFDFVVSRAVSALSVLLELASPFVKVGGVFYAYKSGEVEEELEQSKYAAAQLNMVYEDKFCYDLPSNGGSRTILVYRKVALISNVFPRKAGTPKRNPLTKGISVE